MKKNLPVTILLIILIFICASCAPVVRRTSGETITGRDGKEVSVPASLSRIISMGPSNTEILAALGLSGSFVAVDTYSGGFEGVKDGIAFLDMMNPDAERMVALAPDLILVTGMMQIAGEDPLQSVSDAGVCVVYIPTSNSISDIKKDIEFIGKLTRTEQAAQNLVKKMDTAIDEIETIGKTIAVKKTVYFEISPAPYLYSFGTGVFLNEMIELIGAENVFGGVESWISVQEEVLVASNPDVILTVTDYIDDPVGEIMSRSGWGVITAVKNADVYFIETNAATLPNHNIVTALKQMAEAVYPDKYK